MRSCLLGLGILAAAGAQPALAADEFIKGLYLKSEALCAEAKKSSLQTVIEAGNVVLSSSGLDSIEYNCVFVQVLKHPGPNNAWIATAYCEEPGYASPDVFSITERSPGSIELVSLAETKVQNMPELGVPGTEDGVGAGENAAPPAAGVEADPSIVDESSSGANGGTYVLCDGVTLP